jgi:hypothetical protein
MPSNVPMPSSLPQEPLPTWVSSSQNFQLGATPLRVRVQLLPNSGLVSLVVDVSHGRGHAQVMFTGTRDQIRDLLAELLTVATGNGLVP